ncbi:MAG: PhzF family phenazine biosynthesis protein [Alphaproteobacteria bacterium]
MSIQHIAAFSDGSQGGNPAGVLIADTLPPETEMQEIARQVGFSETAFAAPQDDGWRVRYFSPETEVPFCGHATIALGAALALQHGDAVFPLHLNDADITVEGRRDGAMLSAALQSPPTKSRPAEEDLVAEALDLFSIDPGDLDPRLPPAIAEAGATHLVLALNSREALARMAYDLDRGRAFMNAHGLVTVALVYSETPTLFHVRNPFASGGVYEDPATGAAAAALAGYLRDRNWPSDGAIDIVQGEDMGARSLLEVRYDETKGGSIRVSGAARVMD